MAADTVSDGSPQQLCRRACEEIRQRLRAGEPCRAEAFLSAHPSLTSDPELAVEVIFTEFLVRKELGEAPDPLHWLDRFPQYRKQLTSILEIYRLLEEMPQGGVSTGVSTAEMPETRESIDLDGPVPALEGHEKLGELGRGAMGVVFRARDKVLDRVVALKTIKAGLLAGPEEVRRFYREARAAARLHHPNIVPVHHMGLFEGQHSYTMGLVEGGNLARHVGRYAGDYRATAALVEKVARAVHAAHTAGVVHRDLKPANILLDKNGEPLVADFGLAKFDDPRPEMSQPGQRLGTPAYMSPEQARGHTWEVSPRSDVWALGVILYELLTQQRPFRGADTETVLRQVLTADPPPPRRARPDVPRDLETIVLKCLEKEPSRRYPSAEAVAEDLDRWLRGERPHAAPPRKGWRRAGRWLRRLALPVLAALPLAYFVATAPVKPPRTESPEEVLQGLRERLARGEAVTLIGDRGGPKWSRWSEGEEGTETRTHHPEGGSFTIQTMRRARLELLPEVPLRSYRLRAQVRHDDSSQGGGGFVGIYCLHARAPSLGADEFFPCEFCLNDNDQLMPRWVWLKMRRLLTNTRGGSDPRPLWRLPPPDRKAVGVFGATAVGLPAFPPGQGLFLAASALAPDRADQSRWFDLELVVTPEKVRAMLGGEDVATLDRGSLRLLSRTLSAKNAPLAPGALAEFSVHGGVGLIVYRGSASFRNVVLQPLAEDGGPQ